MSSLSVTFGEEPCLSPVHSPFLFSPKSYHQNSDIYFLKKTKELFHLILDIYFHLQFSSSFIPTAFKLFFFVVIAFKVRSSELRQPSTGLHGVKSQKVVLFVVTTLRALNPTTTSVWFIQLSLLIKLIARILTHCTKNHCNFRIQQILTFPSSNLSAV
jgi:hypothetical protein